MDLKKYIGRRLTGHNTGRKGITLEDLAIPTNSNVQENRTERHGEGACQGETQWWSASQSSAIVHAYPAYEVPDLARMGAMKEHIFLRFFPNTIGIDSGVYHVALVDEREEVFQKNVTLALF